MAPERSSPFRLLVEGRDDMFSIINLLKRHGYDWDTAPAPFVYDANGIDPLLESLPLALNGSVGFSSPDALAIPGRALAVLSVAWRLGRK